MGGEGAPHLPVLLRPLLQMAAPVTGVWVDGTFGAGGYTRGLIEAGAEHVIGIDRDPLAHEMAQNWIGDWPITLKSGNFSDLDQMASGVDGVVLDLGVSSMQLDRAERGFSFLRDGPLDMRMGQAGRSAADLVNELPEATLADIMYLYGEERQSRRIARRICEARKLAPFETTLQLANLIERTIGRSKPGQAHSATRAFQALRIAVNDEFGALASGLMAAERALKPGGVLAVVTFHSIEDRMVKRFFQARGARKTHKNRYARMPEEAPDGAFEILTRKAIGPDKDELAHNPRARSARLRGGRRTQLPAEDVSVSILAMPGAELRQEV